MSEWQRKELATTFLDGVRGAIPGADLQLAVIGKIVQLWLEGPSRILDLGCGNGLLARFLLGLFPAAAGVCVDFSEPMLEACHQNLAGYPQARILKADFGTPDWVLNIEAYRPFDLIVSGFAIHHQSDDRKRALYSEIHDLLAPGGVFLNLEHVASSTAAGEKLFDEFFIDRLQEYHARADSSTSRDAIAETYYTRPDKKENLLAPVEEQCQWLRQLGFRDVDCFFKIFELALFGGRKKASETIKVPAP